MMIKIRNFSRSKTNFQLAITKAIQATHRTVLCIFIYSGSINYNKVLDFVTLDNYKANSELSTSLKRFIVIKASVKLKAL